jgi:hypothetical protein
VIAKEQQGLPANHQKLGERLAIDSTPSEGINSTVTWILKFYSTEL